MSSCRLLSLRNRCSRLGHCYASTSRFSTNRMAASEVDVSAPTPESTINFLKLIHSLKTSKRTGWIRKNVPKPESIADHMYRMGVMALLAQGTPGLDYNRCASIAIVHDIAEAIVGDITPHCGVSDQDKHALEREAIQTIQHTLGTHTLAAQDIGALWDEYEAASTFEAKTVKDFDKLEMIIQALEYSQAHPTISLQEFFDTTAGKWRTDLGRAWAAEVESRFAALENGAHSEAHSNANGRSAAPVADFTDMPTPKQVVDFLMLLQQLKATPRTGWVRLGVEAPESIADHMHRMSIMSLLLQGIEGLDHFRCVKMALVHDIAEAIVGDITPHCNVSGDEKYRREHEAIEQMRQMLGSDTACAKELFELWLEYEGASSLTAQHVKDMDKAELRIQALEYQEAYPSKDFQEFYNSTHEVWKTPVGRAWGLEAEKRILAVRAESQQAAKTQSSQVSVIA